jgi:hypothetical protein
MTRPFAFADESVSHDTVQALEMLTAMAKRGEATGLAYTVTTVIDKKKGYNVNATGLLHDSPAFAIGTVVILLYRLVIRAIGGEK